MTCSVDATALSGRTSGFNGVITQVTPIGVGAHILRAIHSAHAEPRTALRRQDRR